MASAKEESKRLWSWDDPTPLDALKFGALQRIADACELMVKDREKMIRDLEYWKKEELRERQLKESAQRSAISLRGQITKLKKQLAEAQSTK